MIQIPSCVTSKPDTKELVYELEAFGDASSSAYAAEVYLVIKSRITTQDRLIASKTRVGPLNKHTITRLELSAALILARLTARIKTTLPQCLVISRVRCWTDSKNVLYLVDVFENDSATTRMCEGNESASSKRSGRKQLYNCVVCRRHERYPFASQGVDFAGPLSAKAVFGNEIQVSKEYICLFTCGSTRAKHIELTPSLTT